jgi:tuftelin-interacting protein 11
LDRWDPKDHSVLSVLKPWQAVFDPANWDPIIEKVLARLEWGINKMSIRPDGQDLGPVKDLILWLDLAPTAGLARVLEAAFFPPWQAALREWLRAPACDFGEVLQWYQGWKALFPEALQKQGSVQRQLAQGLEVMQHCMSGGALPANAPPQVTPTAEKAAAPHPVPGGDAHAAKAPDEEVSLSLSDYLAEVAGEEGLVFRPKKTLSAEGKQVYQLGSVSVCLGTNLVYAAFPRQGGGGAGGDDVEWRPTPFEELFNLARAGKQNTQRW